MNNTIVFRSCLYVPGHKPHLFPKAVDGECDAIMLDLEDAVPADRKDYATSAVAEILSEPISKPTFVRVNSIASSRTESEIQAICKPGLRGVRLPKCTQREDIQAVDRWLTECGSSAVIHPLLESADAIERAYELATASPRISMMGLGEADLQAHLGTQADGATMDTSRAKVIIASRAAELASPAQSVYPQICDLVGLRTSSIYGRKLGFVGRMCIHPNQVPIIHEVYTPSKAEIAEATEVCAAADNAVAKRASVVLTESGRFVGPPLVAIARRTLQLAHNVIPPW